MVTLLVPVSSVTRVPDVRIVGTDTNPSKSISSFPIPLHVDRC